MNLFQNNLFQSLASGVLLAVNKAKQGSGIPIWVPLIPIAVLFYFLMIRPQSKEKAKAKEMLDGLQKHDRVVTIGGIYGSVVTAQKGSDSVLICIDENNNSRIKVSRSAIARVLGAEDDKGPAEKN